MALSVAMASHRFLEFYNCLVFVLGWILNLLVDRQGLEQYYLYLCLGVSLKKAWVEETEHCLGQVVAAYVPYLIVGLPLLASNNFCLCIIHVPLPLLLYFWT